VTGKRETCAEGLGFRIVVQEKVVSWDFCCKSSEAEILVTWSAEWAQDRDEGQAQKRKGAG
jgi:hypothetical protein